MIRLLLEKGADLYAKDENGRTPLSWAVRWEKEKVIELSIDKGADLEFKDDFNQTPPLWAATKGHDRIVKLLLDKGADLEAKDRTPLALAIQWRREEVVRLLLDRNADVEAKDIHGRTPLATAGDDNEMKRLLIDKAK